MQQAWEGSEREESKDGVVDIFIGLSRTHCCVFEWKFHAE